METFRRIAFLGGYVPRQCGIATFTHDLFQAVQGATPASDCWVAAVTDRSNNYDYPAEVRLHLDAGDRNDYRRSAKYLNSHSPEVLCLQHEFGIYGGAAGRYVLDLVKDVKAPVVSTLHTVLTAPSVEQREAMDEICRRSARVVVMAERGAEILREIYGVPGDKIDVIPHGIPDVPLGDGRAEKATLGYEGRTILLTFGLLGRGKGIEHAIRAMPAVVARHPEALYVVLGATHPHLVAHEGECYREELEQLARDCGVVDHVRFENHFVSPDDLDFRMAAADIYVTPYPNEAQITSGTLARAFGAGKAVVSTPYWHAQELLKDGAGVLVPFCDPDALGEGINSLLDHPVALRAMRQRAYREGRPMIWPAVAERYLESFARAKDRPVVITGFTGRPLPVPRAVRMDHVMRFTDGTGMFQHAIHNVPNFHEGYCTDDNARAYLLSLSQVARGGDTPDTSRLATTTLAFLAAAFRRDLGRFRNFMSHDRRWLESIGSEDSHGRAVWALGSGCARSGNEGHRQLCLQLFQESLPVVKGFTSPRAWAFSMLGIHEYLEVFPRDLRMHRLLRSLDARLVALWHQVAGEGWRWFEDILSYDNARLCQAMIASGGRNPGSGSLEIGLESLEWLMAQQSAEAGHFRPIGSNGFHRRGGIRAVYDQQPLEAQASVAACLEAARVTGNPRWHREARRAFDWFLGANDLGLPLFDATTGGCADGLHPDRLNANQGAESTLAFCLSLADLLAAGSVVTEVHGVKQIA